MNTNTIHRKEVITTNKDGIAFAFDFRYIRHKSKKPVILFLHGIKGFKDWGHFNMMADEYAKRGFVFAKTNFSHDGTSPENPVDFVNLEAFRQNTFSKELEDTLKVLDQLIIELTTIEEEADLDQIYFMAHSRGFVPALAAATQSNKIRGLISLAGVSQSKEWLKKFDLLSWKADGDLLMPNARTGQLMKISYEFVEDFERHPDKFDSTNLIKSFSRPFLAIHGTDDEAVPYQWTEEISSLNYRAEIHLIAGAQHTFGGYHPYESDQLPKDTLKVIDLVCRFIQKTKNI